MKKKLTLDDCIEIAQKRGGKCLSIEYKNNKTHMEWECKLGHIWIARFDAIKRGHWCPYCAGIRNNSLEVCNEIAKQKEGKCLSVVYINAHTLMEWECKEGHRWKTSFACIRAGSWCHKCGKSEMLLLEDCDNYAKSKEGKCLTREYYNNKTKMEWECKYKHRWLACFGGMRFQNQWCPYCAGIRNNSLEVCNEIAKQKEGKCLSVVYINAHTLMEWECKEGHRWMARLNDIKSRYWCPTCSIKKTQKGLTQEVKDIFSLKDSDIISNCRNIEFLKNPNTNTNLEIDIFIPSLKLAIEYDGQHHFRPIAFGGISKEKAKEEFIATKYRDRLKNRLVKKHIKNGAEIIKYFVRFNYKEKKILNKEYIISKLKIKGLII